MASTKAKGSTKLGRDSESKRLGIKRNQDQIVFAGQIIVRQRGTKYIAGENVRRGGDDTLFSIKHGKVNFRSIIKNKFDGSRTKRTEVRVKTI